MFSVVFFLNTYIKKKILNDALQPSKKKSPLLKVGL